MGRALHQVRKLARRVVVIGDKLTYSHRNVRACREYFGRRKEFSSLETEHKLTLAQAPVPLYIRNKLDKAA